MKKMAFLLTFMMASVAMAGISVSFPKKTTLADKDQKLIIDQIKVQCPFLVKQDIMANPYSEKVENEKTTLSFTVQIPRSDEGDLDLKVVLEKGKVTVTSDGDYCQK